VSNGKAAREYQNYADRCKELFHVVTSSRWSHHPISSVGVAASELVIECLKPTPANERTRVSNSFGHYI
jgi:hypothetical protein